MRVSLVGAKLQKHRATPLQQVPSDTKLQIFATLRRWSDAPDELQQIVVVVAGDYVRPRFRNKPGKPDWHSGPLRFGSNKTVAFCGSLQLYCGVDRSVCFVEKAVLEDYIERTKKGKEKPRTIYVRGKLSQREVDGKKRPYLSAKVVTLPTTGVNRKEYSYILDPAKLHAKFKIE